MTGVEEADASAWVAFEELVVEPLDELLPDVWFKSHPSARRKKAV